MAVLLKFEGRDGNIYYECSECQASYFESEVDVCPNCGKRFSETVDEVEICHNQNVAYQKWLKNTEDEDASFEMFKWGIQRMILENSF